jgi:signal transduction histidine kinase
MSSLVYAGRESAQAPFREADLEMFLILARQAAIAMENARLYAELRDYVRRVEDSQQALLQAEKMAAAGRLTASIAHEINNPLQAVQNCIHLAGHTELPAEKRQEYFELACSELDRLRATVQRMLDFYRPNAVAPQAVDVADMCLA